MPDFDSLKANLSNLTHIACGGQKVVFSATHPSYGNVVLKLFFEMDARSQREIDISQGSDFGCVPTIYETGRINYEGADTLYVIEQRVDGEELYKRIDRGERFTLEEVADFLEQGLRFIKQLEGKNIVHRDIKPENIMISANGTMQSMCKDLSSLWGGASVIISPLNISESKLASFAQSLVKANGSVLFDPQMYSPRKIHKNLQPYSYWPQSGITSIELGDYGKVLESLAKINEQTQTEAFILPSNTTTAVNAMWHGVQSTVAEQARKVANGRKLIHTIALTSDVLSDENQIESIVENTRQWDVDGVYIVCEHPGGYLVDKPLWVSNL
jgi:serine/threonine protein kinase